MTTHERAARFCFKSQPSPPRRALKEKDMARTASRLKLGYYPLSEPEAGRIRKFLVFSAASTAVDPCAGTGAALRTITSGAECRLHGIELDSLRAAAAAEVLDQVVQGSVFETHCAVDSFSVLLLNPPYDDELCDEETRRTEGVFLEWCYRWLRPGGVLVLVIPAKRMPSCTNVLAAQFRDVSVYRLASQESAQWEQVVIFAVRRNRRERERLTDYDVARARQTLSEMVLGYRRLMPLGEPGRTYAVPPSDGGVRLVYRGLPLDTIEDMLADSRAYWQAGRALFAPQVQVVGRPLSPLHEGHAGLLSCSGLIDGAFGDGADRHVACWQARKVIDRSEEEDEKGVVTIREKERFTQALTLIYADGRTAEISEETTDGECTPAPGAA
jgi:tRNA1(Val) A37 N6-methylase TrmN6